MECRGLEEEWVAAWVEVAAEWAAVEVVAWAAAEVWEVAVDAAVVKAVAVAEVEREVREAATGDLRDFDTHVGIRVRRLDIRVTTRGGALLIRSFLLSHPIHLFELPVSFLEHGILFRKSGILFPAFLT